MQSLCNRLWHEERLADSQLRNALTLANDYSDLIDAGLRLFTAGRRSWQDLMTLQREQHQVQMQRADAEAALLGARLRTLWLADALPDVRLSELTPLSLPTEPALPTP